jgi:hypothetical protein
MIGNMVAELSPADELPRLYRATLVGIDTLERRGRRAEAAAIRREAIACYSAAWDEHHRHVLAGLLERVRRECERPHLAAGETVDRRRALIGLRARRPEAR